MKRSVRALTFFKPKGGVYEVGNVHAEPSSLRRSQHQPVRPRDPFPPTEIQPPKPTTVVVRS